MKTNWLKISICFWILPISLTQHNSTGQQSFEIQEGPTSECNANAIWPFAHWTENECQETSCQLFEIKEKPKSENNDSVSSCSACSSAVWLEQTSTKSFEIQETPRDQSIGPPPMCSSMQIEEKRCSGGTCGGFEIQEQPCAMTLKTGPVVSHSPWTVSFEIREVPRSACAAQVFSRAVWSEQTSTQSFEIQEPPRSQLTSPPPLCSSMQMEETSCTDGTCRGFEIKEQT